MDRRKVDRGLEARGGYLTRSGVERRKGERRYPRWRVAGFTHDIIRNGKAIQGEGMTRNRSDRRTGDR